MSSAPAGQVADLQLHSSASDGSDAPAEVVRRASRAGFSAIALTDHDTMDGLPEAAAAAAQHGIELVPACEMSTLDAGGRQIDILAYGVSPGHAAFAALLSSISGARPARALGMVRRLNELGYDVSWERVQAIAGGPNIGRPHVAQAMVEAGVVPDIKSAFTPEFIGDGGRCYVQRAKISPSEAIDAIHGAGGVAVAAHPGRTGLSDDDIAGLVAAGLDGLEVFYPWHRGREVAHFGQLAEQHGLLVTGGSDDHGSRNEGRLMGRVRLPYAHVERLREAIRDRGGAVALVTADA